MTAFEIAVPLLAIAVGVAGAWLLRREARQIDRDQGDGAAHGR